MHVLDYYFSKKNNYAFSNKNHKLEKLVIKKTLFYDDISTSTLRAMRAQTQEYVYARPSSSYHVNDSCTVKERNHELDEIKNFSNIMCNISISTFFKFLTPKNSVC